MKEEEQNNETSSVDITDNCNGSFADAIEKLHVEKERIENELRHEYRNIRKYVRSHPETALAYTFIGGVAMGLILAKLVSR